MTPRRPRDTFLHYIGRERTRLILGLLFAFGSGFAAVIPPRYVGQIVDSLQQKVDFGTLTTLGALFITAAAAENLLRAFSRLAIFDASRLIEARMRSDLFAHLPRMHLGYFQHQPIGDLMARLTNDLTAVRQMLGQGIQTAGTTVVTFGFALAAMVSLSLKLSIVALVLLPLASVSFAFIGKRVHVRFERLQAKFSDLATRAQENFSGIRVVKAFGREEAELGAFTKIARDYYRHAISLVLMQGAVAPTLTLIIGLAALTALYFGGQDAIRGELTIGQLVQFLAYLQLLSLPMVQIGQITNQVQQGWASLARLQELYDADPAIIDGSEHVERRIEGRVEFKDVSFSYGDVPVLHHVDVTVPAGGSLGIVGHTGAGKSTLVSLIPRLFDPTSGAVLVDGVDTRAYDLLALRRWIGFVPQETFLFSLPLRLNVAFGREEELTEAELDWAGDISQLNKDVEAFPTGYETIIGERGVTLSGGQKQRTAIARAVAKDPRILILDDGVSSVDTLTESEILKRFRDVMKGRTTIIVAHRISTVKDLDQILVLEDGRMAELGTHQQLLERRGRYAQTYRRQLLEQELDVDEEQTEHDRRLRELQPDAPPAPLRAPDMGMGGTESGS